MNQDNGVPTNTKLDKNIITTNFPEDKPIYWGPTQNTVFPHTYIQPTGWKINEPLIIPKVMRCFFGDGGTAGGGDCNNGVPPVFFWELIAKRDHIDPFPHDYILQWHTTHGASDAFYSIPQFVMSGGILRDQSAEFSLGMRFEFGVTFPITFSFDLSEFIDSFGNIITPL